MQNVMADIAVSVSELKKNPSAVVEDAKGSPVAVLNHNRVMAYMVPSETFEAILERLDDQALVEIARMRAGGPTVKVKLDDL
jgi:antitoxin StbD